MEGQQYRRLEAQLGVTIVEPKWQQRGELEVQSLLICLFKTCIYTRLFP